MIRPHGSAWLDLDLQGRVVDSEGRVNPSVYVVGAARRGIEWEVAAVPDLRAQAARLAAALVTPGTAVPVGAAPVTGVNAPGPVAARRARAPLACRHRGHHRHGLRPADTATHQTSLPTSTDVARASARVSTWTSGLSRAHRQPDLEPHPVTTPGVAPSLSPLSRSSMSCGLISCPFSRVTGPRKLITKSLQARRRAGPGCRSARCGRR